MIEWYSDHWYKITVPGVEILDPWNEIYIPSVTTKLNIIAKPFLAKWRGDVGNREADMRVFEASERGVRIHNAWYTLTTGGAVLFNPVNRPNYSTDQIDALSLDFGGNIAVVKYQDEMVDVWKLERWIEAVKPVISASELPVYSLKTMDAGTVDNVMEIEAGKYMVDGAKALELPAGKYVVDLKSGKQVDDNAFLQTAAYSKCYEEMTGEEIMGTLILHTGASTKKGIEGLSTLYRTKEELQGDFEDYRLAAQLWERKNRDAKPRTFLFPALLTLKKEI
jgi:hypothetical protein